MKKRFAWICAFAFLFGVEPSSAYAYLDPGTGTFALQGLIAAVAGGLVAIRAYWSQIKGMFRRSGAPSESSTERSLHDDA
jgi:hypothetical protein